MAFTVTPQITGQDISSTTSYCYMYEPLKVNAIESNADVTKISIDLVVHNTQTGTVVQSNTNYASYDAIQNVAVEIDLSKIMQQYHDANTFHIGSIADLASLKDIPVSKYKYYFSISSDSAGTTAKSIKKLPIIGGRDFYDFNASISQTQPLTEAGLNAVTLSGRWKNYPNITTTLGNPTSTNSAPNIVTSTESSAELEPCGGMIIWKSRFGGWMYWGMDIATRTQSSSYKGDLDVGMFEASALGNPYIQTDYTKIDSSYSITLKALNLTNDELESVAGIINSVAVYYMRNSSAKLELMRVSNATAPISSLIGGGDFSVNLKSISTSSQKAR